MLKMRITHDIQVNHNVWLYCKITSCTYNHEQVHYKSKHMLCHSWCIHVKQCVRILLNCLCMTLQNHTVMLYVYLKQYNGLKDDTLVL